MIYLLLVSHGCQLFVLRWKCLFGLSVGLVATAASLCLEKYTRSLTEFGKFYFKLIWKHDWFLWKFWNRRDRFWNRRSVEAEPAQRRIESKPSMTIQNFETVFKWKNSEVQNNCESHKCHKRLCKIIIFSILSHIIHLPSIHKKKISLCWKKQPEQQTHNFRFKLANLFHDTNHYVRQHKSVWCAEWCTLASTSVGCLILVFGSYWLSNKWTICKSFEACPWYSRGSQMYCPFTGEFQDRAFYIVGTSAKFIRLHTHRIIFAAVFRFTLETFKNWSKYYRLEGRPELELCFNVDVK